MDDLFTEPIYYRLDAQPGQYEMMDTIRNEGGVMERCLWGGGGFEVMGPIVRIVGVFYRRKVQIL